MTFNLRVTNMHLAFSLIAVTLTISHWTMSSAQEPTLDTPQPEHKMLERFAGEWHFEKQSAPEGGSKPENLGTGMISAELVGSFFVVSRWSGKLYGGDYKAIQSLGYDIKQKKYT